MLSGQFAHGGDLSRAGLYGGSGGESIYGIDPWPDENHILNFDRRWVVAVRFSGYFWSSFRLILIHRMADLRSLYG